MRLPKFLFVIGAFLFFAFPAYAAVKDTDIDGLTDEGERTVYRTDPNRFDTDGDGVGDGQEILSGTNPLDAASSRVTELTAPIDGPMLGDGARYARYVGLATGGFVFIFLSFGSIYWIRLKRLRAKQLAEQAAGVPPMMA
jgi:hypothetical protein